MAPLEIKFFKNKETSEMLLVLREYIKRNKVKVLVISNAPIIRDIDLSQVCIQPDIIDELKLLRDCMKIATTSGYLFLPAGPLTYRERTDEGPSHCRNCHSLLSFEKGFFGCTQCHSYVCKCCSCLCGSSVLRDWRGNFIPEKQPLPCLQRNRLEYVRIGHAIKNHPLFSI